MIVSILDADVLSDLKSDNIFFLELESKPQAFSIGDLDTAKVITSDDKAKTTIGTPSFIAPEVLESNNEKSYSSLLDSKWAAGDAEHCSH